MNTNPAIAGTILRNFSIIVVAAVGGVFATDRVIGIANRAHMAERRSGVYNDAVHPEQDRLDTIFDRKQEMNLVKTKKPWNKTLAEKERVKQL